MSRLHHPAQPCSECPFRRDQPAGRFSPGRYEFLANTSVRADKSSAELSDPLFACHKSPEGRETACAGWLAVEGRNHPRVRLDVALGRLEGEALEPGPGWPELFGSFREMARFNGADVD